MNDENTLLDALSTLYDEPATTSYARQGKLREEEILEIRSYPEDLGDMEVNEDDRELAELVQAAQEERQKAMRPAVQQDMPIGYVTNARNAASTSDTFQFWATAEETTLGIGSIVRHTATHPQTVHTYAIIVETLGNTLGLDDYAIHVYEQDAQPPLVSILPAPSARRPIVHYQAKVLASTQRAQRPVPSGPVYAVLAEELALVHGKNQQSWLDPTYLLTGFYEDANGEFGLFGEERARVLGPKQGHVIFSGLPGAGKTSLFLTLVISLYAQLKNLKEGAGTDKMKVPRVATLAINVKGADLLFLDHQDDSELEEHDLRMWRAANVDTTSRPFGRVIVYTPLKEDGRNRYSLRSNPAADIFAYSETREFALGIQDIWPYLDLFFDKPSTGISSLIAEVAEYLNETHPDGFTLADVRSLFDTTLKLPKAARGDPWSEFHASTIQAVSQRFRSLPTTLKGLIDVTGKGFGLNALTDLQPYDLVVVDIERIMANPSDPAVAESTIKIITAYILKQLTEVMTQGKCAVDNVIVFADELNRLAPRDGNAGIGEYLAQLARTTRDRGIVLFGAGQFRSGIKEDILKAASVHYSMRTPEYEVGDRIYGSLSPEFKARLTQLEPGETLLQYPSLRTAVFTRFPRPFVVSGAQTWQTLFPPIEERPLDACIFERLSRLDQQRPPLFNEVKRLMESLMDEEDDSRKKSMQTDLMTLLRDIEMSYSTQKHHHASSPWQQFAQLASMRHQKRKGASTQTVPSITPTTFVENEEDDFQ